MKIFKVKWTLLIGLPALLIDSTWAKASIDVHSYPNSGGLSGSVQGAGGHSYPAVSRHSYSPSASEQINSLYPGSHNYPSSVSNQRYNTSSGQKHSYLPSTIVHNNSSYPGSKGYPSSASRQTNNTSRLSPSYPTSGNRHTYPSSTPSYVYPPPHNSIKYSSGRHTYPSTTVRYSSSGGKLISVGGKNSHSPSSNSNNYKPLNNSGVSWRPSLEKSRKSSSSGNKKRHHTGNAFPSGSNHNGRIHSTTTYSNNYYYKPPKQIIHNPRHGGPFIKYPVYHGEPPNYIYQYRGSRSKYRKLLAGLALMNLGTLGVARYAAYQSSAHHGSTTYIPQPGEICKLVIKKDNGHYEETIIDCQIISSFIFEGMQVRDSHNVTSHINQTVTVSMNPPSMLSNGTLLDVNNGYAMAQNIALVLEPGVSNTYDMLPNGTLVPKGSLSDKFRAAGGSRVTKMTELKNALYVKGEPIEVNSRMECFVIMIRPTWNMRKTLPCRLLEIYADSSLRINSSVRNMPTLVAIVAVILAYGVAY